METQQEIFTLQETIKKFSLQLFKLVLWGIIFHSSYNLFFSKGGIQDYHHLSQELNKQQNYLDSLNQENKMLLAEIEHMENDSTYQKKLIRKHLGVLAEDEFVVLNTVVK